MAAAIGLTQADDVNRITRWLEARNLPIDSDAVTTRTPTTAPSPGRRRPKWTPSSTSRRNHRPGVPGLMIGHQQNAVEMARTELAAGRDRWTRNYATAVAESRRAEVSEATRLSAVSADSG